ncbi:hypothetical protein EJF36_08380 [Bacillus sp. HMF5848]|uniref:hypothetical protein n=1 Tax=Bacillus sp. HMF5848 TaxID=2495421 RepID=UPI000F779A76|nr:hypothetical protein [Bacillus sp. HMF5848]RSK26881.1 hypothetical protein EJF36_08380 [Bacillus sp. HMF5848]
MKKVMNSEAGTVETGRRQAVLRLEIDYELATLFDAMQTDDCDTIKKCKQNLQNLREEMIHVAKYEAS